MNASISKARALVCECVERCYMLDRSFAANLIVGTAVEAYKNLIKADECSLQEVAGRAERQHFQKEAIAECRVLAGLLECFFGEDVKDSLCKRAAEVRRMTAAWLHGEQRQVIQKGAVK